MTKDILRTKGVKNLRHPLKLVDHACASSLGIRIFGFFGLAFCFTLGLVGGVDLGPFALMGIKAEREVTAVKPLSKLLSGFVELVEDSSILFWVLRMDEIAYRMRRTVG